MDLQHFYADADSAPFAGFDSEPYPARLQQRKVGSLDLRSGEVGTADPFITDEHFLRFEVPEHEGSAWVFATQADVSVLQDESHQRIAYLSVIFSRDEPADILPAVPVGHERSELSEGHAFGIGVDAGTVGFFDSEEMLSYLSAIDEDRQEEIREDWIDELYGESETAAEFGRVTFPLSDDERDGEGVLLLSNSGWGDGFYPVYQTVDAQGKILGYHIDLQVVGE